MPATATPPTQSPRAPGPGPAAGHPGAAALVKVPLAITPVFWLVKILTTGMGESASDYLAQWSLWWSAAAGSLALAVALLVQLRMPRYSPPAYWFTVAMVAVFGTVMADVFRLGLGVALPYTTAGYALAVTACFALWHRSEGTLSIHAITGGRRELFYWATVLMTFALGTAAGDLTAFVVNLGFGHSALLFAGALAIPLLLWRFAGLNPIVAFWTAYVLTRPLGASIADWIGKGKPLGLGAGDGTVTLVVAAVVTGVVAVLWRRERDGAGPDATAGSHPAHMFRS